MEEHSLNPIKGLMNLVRDAPMTTLFCISVIALNTIQYREIYQNEKLLRRLEANEKARQGSTESYGQTTNHPTYATIIQKSR